VTDRDDHHRDTIRALMEGLEVHIRPHDDVHGLLAHMAHLCEEAPAAVMDAPSWIMYRLMRLAIALRAEVDRGAAYKAWAVQIQAGWPQ